MVACCAYFNSLIYMRDQAKLITANLAILREVYELSVFMRVPGGQELEKVTIPLA